MKEKDGEVTGVILEGGDSTRFGGKDDDKAFAEYQGRKLIQHVVETVESATGKTPVVAVRTDEQKDNIVKALDHEVRFVYDAEEFEGPLAGLFAAIEEIEAPWIFVSGCDMPLLSEDVVSWILERGSERDRNLDAVIIFDDGKAEPLHSMYRTESLKRFADDSTLDSLQELVERLPNVEKIEADEAPRDLEVEESLRNVNTRDELQGLAQDISVVVEGRERQVFDLEDLESLPTKTVTKSIDCSSKSDDEIIDEDSEGNRDGDPNDGDNGEVDTWRGVEIARLVESVEVDARTTHLVFESADGHRACIGVTDVLDGILALAHGTSSEEMRDNLPRLIAPDVGATRSVKNVRVIEPVEIQEGDPEDYEDLLLEE